MLFQREMESWRSPFVNFKPFAHVEEPEGETSGRLAPLRDRNNEKNSSDIIGREYNLARKARRKFWLIYVWGSLGS